MSECDRKKYEAPRAMRFGDQAAGSGACGAPGSGDAECDTTGSSATYRCGGPGSSASTFPTGPGAAGCQDVGNAAAYFCQNTGSGVEE